MPGALHQKPLEKRSSRLNIQKLSCSTSLPSLPLPDLQETLEQYLLCIKALVPESQFEQTKEIVESFGATGGVGEAIQRRLEECAKTKVNWAYEWWLNDMYLTNPASLPINSNPGMVLPKQNFEDQLSMLQYAAKITSGILDFKVILDARALPVDVARGQLAGQAMCMEQYYRLLNSYRLPGYTRDKLVSLKSVQSDEPEHVIVVCNNQFFVVPVMMGNYRLSEAEFVSQFQRILDAAHDPAEHNPPVGVLTSLKRPDWAEAREIMMSEPINRLSLDYIEQSIFILCLDKSLENEDDVTMAHQMLYGGGPEKNSCNRWYDKTIQLIIGSDGKTGLSYEHSASEGIAVTALIEHLLKYIALQEKKGAYRSNSSIVLPSPRRLQWRLNPSVNQYVEIGKAKNRHVANSLDLEILRYTNYGKDFIKRQNMSPDAYVQVCLQITYYKLYKRLVSTYESASTRRFREGRVDNIRAATVQALELAKGLTEPDESGKIKMDAKKMLLLRRAVKAQTDFTIAAITGHGIDCHLLGLKQMADEMGLPTPGIFKDSSYELSNYFQLSTSQIPTSTDSFMCYGPVVPDGYGVSYNPHSNSIIFCTASFRTCPSTSSEKFVAALVESLHIMKEICVQWNRRRSSSLEHLSIHRKLSLHRRVDARSYSVDCDALREEFSAESDSSDNEVLEKKKILKKQKSFTTTRMIKRKLERRVSLISNLNAHHRGNSKCGIVDKTQTHTSSNVESSQIPCDLMKLLRQESLNQKNNITIS
uniref:Choline O-acetyltransferase n=2 Tax=Ciona intestinalis TaxID=7719 RepID=F6UEZ5_CIOIN